MGREIVLRWTERRDRVFLCRNPTNLIAAQSGTMISTRMIQCTSTTQQKGKNDQSRYSTPEIQGRVTSNSRLATRLGIFYFRSKSALWPAQKIWGSGARQHPFQASSSFQRHFKTIWRRQLVLDRFSEPQGYYYGPMAVARRSTIAGADWQRLRMMT